MALAKKLTKVLNIDVAHALYSEDGQWYHVLTRFPGALFDKNGFVVFQTKAEYETNDTFYHGKELNIPKGISSLPNYRLYTDAERIKIDSQITNQGMPVFQIKIDKPENRRAHFSLVETHSIREAEYYAVEYMILPEYGATIADHGKMNYQPKLRSIERSPKRSVFTFSSKLGRFRNGENTIQITRANNKKPSTIFNYTFDESIFDLWSSDKKHKTEFVGQENRRSYYVLGSKYGASNDRDVLPTMIEQSVVCVGFHKSSLDGYYRKSEKEIVDYLVKKKEASKSYSALKVFLQLKPGDIVAVKSNGSPLHGKANLEIGAYAMIVERNGNVYSYNSELRHCLNAEFIETDVARKFELGGYGRTIHRITDLSLQKELFETFQLTDDGTIRDRIKARNRTGVSQKSTAPQIRKGSQPYVSNQRHNEIQNRLYAELKIKHGEDAVTMEVDHIDLKVDLGDCIVLYEVKPYDSPEDCVRAALGQILAYGFFSVDTRKKKYIIVGPNAPSDEERAFIQFIKNALNLDFDYMNFE
jgi:hypothetical protein